MAADYRLADVRPGLGTRKRSQAACPPYDRPMTDEASLEDKRTAVALVQCQIRDDKAGWWALVRGTEDLKGVVASLSSIAATLADVLGQVTARRLRLP